GIAYVYDKEKVFRERCNLKMVSLEKCAEEDKALIYNLIHNHSKYTGSSIASGIIESFNEKLADFVKVIPLEYKKILESRDVEEKIGLTEVSDG
ncbi:MAG: hypothetical protein JW728_04595, partial [Candidatus Aureabacteria bacterium]|nr:hypothetical protein [Candidatus Auribacterota bacterium]